MRRVPLLLVGLAVVAVTLHAQAPSFEIASIKPNKSGDPNSASGPTPGGGFAARNQTVKNLILEAFRIPESRLKSGPRWLETDRYDVDAKSAVPGSVEQALAMLQELLAARFKLRSHWETKKVPGYALVVAKGGPKLKPNTEAVCTPPCGGTRDSPSGMLSSRKVSLSRFAIRLEAIVGRPVIDRTALVGDFDMDLEWAPEASQYGGQGRETPNDQRPSLSTALEEQLGLKLQPASVPIQILVMDHVEQPMPD